MKFTSTRDKKVSVEASKAIAMGISAEGGLFVPVEFPKVPMSEIVAMKDMSYAERAGKIISKYLTDFTYEEVMECCEKAYSRFDGDPAPVVKLDEGLFLLELWHGPTCAFKDIALTILPHLMVKSKEKQGIKEDICVLVATSGDTGKAALEGFKDVDGTKIVVFYPSEGVSSVQKLQMVTQDGNNVFVAGVDGNFDDCQSAVKAIFADKEFNDVLKKKGVVLSSANSINWGRLVPQIAYYFSAYADLLDSEEINEGDEVNFCVPTGNFGNILAGYYAKKMGLPIGKLICASNSNNILTDFFNNGEYNMNREFIKTMSPSMDILISSNLERLVFEFCDRNDGLVVERMKELKNNGLYKVAEKESKIYNDNFFAGFADEEETEATIDEFDVEYDYILDPHTAVGINVYNEYIAETQDEKSTIVLSTANPFKFAEDVYASLESRLEVTAFEAVDKLANLTGLEIPESILKLKNAEINFSDIFAKDELKAVIENKVINK